MNDRMLIRLVLVTLVLALTSNVLVLKQMEATGETGAPPANVAESGCQQFCDRLDELYTITPDGFSDRWNRGNCERICSDMFNQWFYTCHEKYMSGDGRDGCDKYVSIARGGE